MARKNIVHLITAALLLAFSQASNATPIGIDTTGATAISSSDIIGNDVIPSGVDGWIGADLNLLADAYVTYTFIGEEAGNWNLAFLPENSYFSVNSPDPNPLGATNTSPGDSYTALATGGFLFALLDLSGLGIVDNNNEGTGNVDFWVGQDPTDAHTWWVGFNDAYTGDADYDDLVMTVSASVPEPSILLLMGLGLLAVGATSRLRKA